MLWFRSDVLRVADEAGVAGFVGDHLLHLPRAEGAVVVHGGFDALVPEELLDEFREVPGAFKVPGNAVPEEMGAYVGRCLCFLNDGPIGKLVVRPSRIQAE